jgi:hypothetical protein
MGHYDLYGNSYGTRREALNAETAQMAAIDADIAYREMEDMKRQLSQLQQPTPIDEELNRLHQRIAHLEERLEKLEKQNPIT